MKLPHIMFADLQLLKSLMEEGTKKNFSNCPTYAELRDTVKVKPYYN